MSFTNSTHGSNLKGMTVRTLLISFFICLSTMAFAQAPETTATPKHRWMLYGGIGPNVYFNNLEVADDKVKPVNYTFVARLMWEPEYLLRIGIETGYNQLYTISGSNPATGDVSIVNAVIPIQGVISMKFLDHFYGNFNLGFGLLLNNVTTQNQGNFDDSVMSLGDFAAAIGYRKDMSERFTLGAELRGTYSGKLQDKNIALCFMAGYRLW